MAACDESDDVREADSSNVDICARTLNSTIGELARCYGIASVAAALTEVMGCAWCATARVERGTNNGALVERLGANRVSAHDGIRTDRLLNLPCL